MLQSKFYLTSRHSKPLVWICTKLIQTVKLSNKQQPAKVLAKASIVLRAFSVSLAAHVTWCLVDTSMLTADVVASTCGVSTTPLLHRQSHLCHTISHTSVTQTITSLSQTITVATTTPLSHRQFTSVIQSITVVTVATYHNTINNSIQSESSHTLIYYSKKKRKN